MSKENERIETPEQVAESIDGALAAIDLADVIRQDRLKIARALIKGHGEVTNGGGSGLLCKLIVKLGYRWNADRDKWEVSP